MNQAFACHLVTYSLPRFDPSCLAGVEYFKSQTFHVGHRCKRNPCRQDEAARFQVFTFDILIFHEDPDVEALSAENAEQLSEVLKLGIGQFIALYASSASGNAATLQSCLPCSFNFVLSQFAFNGK